MRCLVLLLPLLVIACSTVPAQKTADAVILPNFSEEIGTVLVGQIKGNCEDLNIKLKAKWNWKSAISTATACYKSKNLAVVDAIAKDLSEKEPNHPWGPYFYALLAKDKEQWERASWMIELAYSRAPDSGVVNYLRGQVQWHDKNFKAGVKSFEFAVKKDTSLTPAQVLLGQVYFQEQEFGRALEYFNAALGNDSKNTAALHGYAECMVQQKQYDDAVSTLYRLADRNPNDSQYLERVVEIQEKFLQDSQAAAKTLKKLEKVKRNVAGSKE